MKYIIIILTLTTSIEVLAEKSLLSKDHLKPFLETYCISCHGATKQKGDVRLDQINLNIETNETAQEWQDILDVLNVAEMPPKKKKQPSKEELAEVLRNLTEGLRGARRKLADQGRKITMRRLNRREYANAIEQLLGLNVDRNDLPPDDPSAPYDTMGANQYFSAYHFEKYFTLGKKLIAQNMIKRRKFENRIFEGESHRKKILHNFSKDLEKWTLIQKGKWKEAGFTDEAGSANFVRDFLKRKKKHDYFWTLPQSESRHYFPLDGKPFTKLFRASIGKRYDPKGTYKVTMNAGLHNTPPEARRYLDIRDDRTPLRSFKVNGDLQNPTKYSFIYKPLADKYLYFILSEKGNSTKNPSQYLKRIDPHGESASIWLDKLEFEGPFYDGLTLLEKLIYEEGYPEIRKTHDLTDERMRHVFTEFAFQAFRRKTPNPEFIEHVLKHYKQQLENKLHWWKAIEEPLAMILTSPNFLYFSEYEGLAGEKLSAHELVIRLANLIWSSPPDEELYQLAESSNILNKDILNQQVERMLNDPRAASLSEGFFAQWLHLKRLDDLSVNTTLYNEYDRGLKLSARQEPIEIFKYMLQYNEPLYQLINADYVIIDQLLAHHYKMAPKKEHGFHKVMLKSNSTRGGILTTAAFLTMTSTGDRTSPIIRGSMIMDQFLNNPPPPPPPNVPELKEASDDPIPIRKMIEMHQDKAQCSSCHSKIDPIGFGLESFDAIGRWRSVEKLSESSHTELSSRGHLPNGTQFHDTDSFKLSLMQYKSRLAESIAEGLYSYGLGRSISFSDREEIEDLVEKWDKDKYRLRSLIHLFSQSKTFQTK